MIIFQLSILFLLSYISILLAYSLLRGAPFAGIGKERMRVMLELLNAKKGKSFVDVGSGDGRIVIEAARKGLNAYGIEINPLLVAISLWKIKESKLKNARILLKDFWKQDFSNFDYVSIWGTTHMMKFLEKKLLKELKPGAKVVSNHFQFPNWQPKKIKNDVYLYVKS